MLLGRDDRTGLGRGPDRLHIEGSDRSHVDDTDIDPGCQELVCRLKGTGDHDAVGNDRGVVTLLQDFGCSDAEDRSGGADEVRYWHAADPEKEWSFNGRRCLYGLFGLPTIGGSDDRQIRKKP